MGDDDIVVRLRRKYSGQLPICIEAANEIERLRKALDESRQERDLWERQARNS